MKPTRRRCSEYGSFALRAMCAAVAAVFAETAIAQALPTGGSVTAGSATIGGSGAAMTVNQTSQRAVIDWSSFNIGNGASVTFAQPGATAMAVNRVGPAANIDGMLNANGHVMILSANGVMFGANASVNVGGLIASTGNINDAQFMAGGAFGITGATSGSVSNAAKPVDGHPERGITVANAGLAAFVAPSVSNSGTIRATGGRIVLASAQAATISLTAGLYEIVINQGITNGTLVNTGTLSTGTAAGSIVLSALDAANVVSGAINLEGIQQASRIEVHGGHVVLKSDLDAAVVTGTSKTIDVCGCGHIQDGIDIAASGATVNVSAGTYVQTATLNVNRSVTLAGAGEANTTIDARTVSGYGILVTADNTSLSGFTLYGPTADVGTSYGIKVQPAGSAPSSRLLNFSISNVTSRGAGRAELDLNGVNGATIDHVTANGAPVGNDSGTTKGAGIQVTDSANVTIKNSLTRNNAWGGVAFYQSNRFYDQQTANNTVQNNNTFTESNPLYLQDESTMHDFGTLNLPGFGYAVRNTATVGSGPSAVDYSQYTWMQATPQGAFDFAVNLLSSGASYIQGWSGSALQTFHVGVGHLAGGGAQNMSIMTAVDRAGSGGATVNVYPGSYTEIAAGRSIGIPGIYDLGLLLYKDNLTLRGVDALGAPIANADNVQAWVTAGTSTNFGMNHGVVADNVTIEGLGFKPHVAGANKTIEIAGDNFTFRNSVVDNRGVPGGAGALYFGELISGPAGEIARLTVTGSKFYDGSVSVSNGVGLAADGVTYEPATQRVISNNTFVGSSNYRFGGLLLTGKMNEIPWRPLPIGAVTATGNRFSGFDDSVLMRGEQQGVDLRQVMRDNSFDRSVLVTDAAGNARGELYASSPSGSAPFTMRPKYSIQSSIQSGLNRSVSGDTVNVGPGTYAESVVLNGLRNLTFNGSTIQSLTVNLGAAGSGIGGSATANGASGFMFNAPIVLLSNTSLSTMGANIMFNADIQNSGATPFALSLMAGSGDITMASGGMAGNPLGQLDTASNNFTLSGTLWVTGFDISAAGSVALSDHSLHATQPGILNTIVAARDVIGTAVSPSPITVDAGGNVHMNIDAPTGSSVHTGGNADINNMGSGLIQVNGKPEVPVTLAPSADNSRMLPSENTITRNSGSAAVPGGGGPAVDLVSALPPALAGEALDQGKPVELDLTPGNQRRR
jgi:filamentous hemagglutinin family protein